MDGVEKFVELVPVFAACGDEEVDIWHGSCEQKSAAPRGFFKNEDVADRFFEGFCIWPFKSQEGLEDLFRKIGKG